MQAKSNRFQDTHLDAFDQTVFKAVFDNAPRAMLLINDKGQYIEANPAASELTGYSKVELIHNRGWDLCQELGAKQWQDFLREGRQNGELELMTKAGSSVRVEYSATANITTGTHLIILQDVSDGTSGQVSTDLANKVVKHAINGLLVVDSQGIIRFVNPAGETLLGRPVDDLVGTKFGYPLAAGEDTELDVIRGQNDIHTIELRTVAIEWEGKPAILASLCDITSRKQMEESLRKSETRYRELFDTITSGVAVYEAVDAGQDFVFREFNPAGEKIEGVNAQDVLGKRVTEVFPGVGDSGILATFQRVWHTSEAEYEPEAMYQDDHHEKTWREHSTYKLPSGEIVAVYNDITERRRFEETLRENEQRYRRMFEKHKAIMLLIDPDTGDILEANQAACDYYGYSQEDLTAMKISDINTLSEQAIKEEMNRARQEERNYFVFRHRLASGEVRDVEVQSGPIDFQGQILLYSIIHDVTERKQAEEALERGREFLSAVLDTMPVGVCLSDEAGCYQMMNKTYAQTFDLDREEMLGQHYTVVLPPDQVESANKFFEQLLNGEEAHLPLERKRQRKDGSIIYVAAANALVRSVDGRKMVITTVRDISLRKQAELEREQLIADLEAYAHTVAHDLKNPIGIVLGFANMLYEDKNMSQEQIDESLSHIMQVSEKMLCIIDELLLLSSVRQMKEVKTKPLDMEHLVENSLSRHYFTIAQNQVAITLPDAWPVALGHGAWIEEIWSNYISNAIKYGGTPPKLELGATVQDDGMVRFWLRDNGPGIAPEKQAQLFTQFTRFDEMRAEGHGLGLSIVKRIIDKLGGEVGVESEGLPGKGSTFYFTLPQHQEG